MTSVLLLKALSRFLTETVSNYSAAQGEDKQFREPVVFDWFLPFKNPKIPEKIDFPYIVPKITNGQDGNERTANSTVHINIAFGVYKEAVDVNGLQHPDGAYDLLNLMDYVRISLFQQGILDKRYKLELPYTWDIPEEQPYPLWVGQANTIWTIPKVDRLIGVDIFEQHIHK